MDTEERIIESFGDIADKFVRQVPKMQDKTEKELQNAADKYRQYMEVVWDIASRMADEGTDLSRMDDESYLCEECCPLKLLEPRSSLEMMENEKAPNADGTASGSSS